MLHGDMTGRQERAPKILLGMSVKATVPEEEA